MHSRYDPIFASRGADAFGPIKEEGRAANSLASYI